VFDVRGVFQVHRLIKLVAEVLLVELKLSNLVVDHVWRPGFRLLSTVQQTGRDDE
jgi:hypothetical protein